MATKVLLRDKNENIILPITRGELVLDSSGKVALHSTEFLATGEKPGLMSSSDKAKLDSVAGGAIDDKLDVNSSNPVLNKVLTQIINSIKEKYLKSASATPNRLTLVDQDDSEINFYNTTYNVVTNTEAGLAPLIVTATDAIQSPLDEWVLTSKNGETPTWKKLPINAFSNDNSDTTYSINGLLSGNNYIITLKDSSDEVTTAVLSPFVGSTDSSAGLSGIVPSPTILDRLKFLRGDGTWATMLQVELNWDNILNKPETFTPESHFHSTSHIVDLLGYSIASDKGDLLVSDTLNVALGKLEYKTNLGVTAYDWYRSVTGEDTDDIINKWGEIVDFIGGITEDTDILSKFVTIDTALTITGVKTFSSKISFPVNTGIYYNNQSGLLGVASKGQWTGHPGTDNYYTFVGTPSYDTILRTDKTLLVYRDSALRTIVDSGNVSQFALPYVELTGTPNANELLQNGIYNVKATLTNAPVTNWGTLLTMGHLYYTVLTYWPDSGLDLYIRRVGVLNSNTTTNWRRLLHTGDLNPSEVHTNSNQFCGYTTAENTGTRYYCICETTLPASNNLTLSFYISRTHNEAKQKGILQVHFRNDGGNLKLYDWSMPLNIGLNKSDFILTYKAGLIVKLYVKISGGWKSYECSVLTNSSWGSSKNYTKFYSSSSNSLTSLPSDETVVSDTIADCSVPLASRLANFYSSRPSNLKPDIIGDGSMYQFKSTSTAGSLTDYPGDGHILHFEWDNNGGYSSQLFIRDHDGLLKTRGMNGKDADGNARWGNWLLMISTNDILLKSRVLFEPNSTDIQPTTLNNSFLTAPISIARGLWSYGGNGYTSTPFGNIDLAGTTVIKVGANDSEFTLLFITPPTATEDKAIRGELLYYINNGSGYSPTWYRVLTNSNYSNYILPRLESMLFTNNTTYVNATLVDPEVRKLALGEGFIEFWDSAVSPNTSGWFNSQWGKIRTKFGYESESKISLLGTTADTSWISFSRTGEGANYITWPGESSASCLLAFGYGNQYAQSYYYMSNKALYPAQTSNTLTLGTSSNRWNNIFSKEGNYTGNLTLYSASGDSPHLVFLRANIDDGTWDWDQYVSGGVWYLRQNSVNNTPNKWQNIVSASDTTVNVHKNLYVVGDTKLDGSLHRHTNSRSGMSSYLASFNSLSSLEKGTIKITLPVSWTSAMAMYEIKIYEYDSYAGSTLLVSGYNFSGQSYHNIKYTVTGMYNKSVRFAHDGTNCCILLGNTDSIWSYPLVFLSNVYGGYSGGNTVISSGYNISVITDESGLTGALYCPKATIDATTATRLVRSTPLDASHTLYYYSGQPNIGTNANEAKEGSNAWNLFSYPVGGTPANTVANIMSLRMLWSTLYLHEIFASPNNRQLWHRWINLGTTKPWSRIVLEDNDSESTTYKLNVDGKTSKIALNGINNDIKYGDYGGIIQSSKNGPTDGWHNSLKILHNNSAGYYTQLALTFTGEEGLWHRRCTAGTETLWKKVIDSDGGTLNKNLYFNHDTINYAHIVFKNTRMKADGGSWADAILTLQNNASAKIAGLGMYGDKATLSYLYIGTGDYNKNNHLRIYTDKLGAMPIQPNVTNSYDLGTSTLRWNILYANRCNLVTKGLQWVGGKTLSNAAIEIATKQTASAYFPIMAVKTSGDHVVNIGGLGDYVGFYGYYSSRTENGTDWEFYFNASNGSIISRSTSDFIRRGGNFVLENTSGGETPHLVFRRGTSTDTAVDFDMYSNSGYLYLRGGSTSLGTLLSLTTSSISIPLTTTIGTSTSNKNLTVYGTTSSTKLTLTQSTGTAPMTISSTTVVTNLNADMVDGKHASDFAIPVGTIMMWAGSTAPTGWLLCNGSAVSRTTYSALFAVISTTYGSGNGSTTFNVPNLVQRFPLGADTQGLIGLDSSRNGYDTTLGKSGGSATHTLTVSELPSHRHSFTALRDNTRVSGKGADVNNTLGIHPSSGYTGYSGSNYAHNNIPPFLAVNFIIKY